MEPNSAGAHSNGSFLPPLLPSPISSNGGVNPETTSSATESTETTESEESFAETVRFRAQFDPRMPRVLTPLGSQVSQLLMEQLTRPALPAGVGRTWRTPGESDLSFTRRAWTMFNETFDSMALVDALFGRGQLLQATSSARARTIEGQVIWKAAGNIVQCLRLLQSHDSSGVSHCLHCMRPPVPAPALEDRFDVLEVRNNLPGSNDTNIDVVSVLPPVRDFDPPMLCKLHLYEFQCFMYRIISPTWKVPHLLEDVQVFGPIAEPRWIGTSFEVEYDRPLQHRR